MLVVFEEDGGRLVLVGVQTNVLVLEGLLVHVFYQPKLSVLVFDEGSSHAAHVYESECIVGLVWFQ